MALVPMGMRFHPSDEEKIHFLVCKVTGQPLPCGEIIGTADLYGEKEPWEILGDSDELCFFTMLKKMGKNNKRFSRNVGNGGTWSNKGQRAPIYGGKLLPGGLCGYKRCFRYEAAKDNDQKNTCLLKEYTLPDHLKLHLNVAADCALCVLKRKSMTTKPAAAHDDHGFDDYFMSLLLLGSQNHDQQQDYYHAPEPLNMSDIARQFIEEEQSTNIPAALSFDTTQQYHHYFASDPMMMQPSYYY